MVVVVVVVVEDVVVGLYKIDGVDCIGWSLIVGGTVVDENVALLAVVVGSDVVVVVDDGGGVDVDVVENCFKVVGFSVVTIVGGFKVVSGGGITIC